MYRMFNSLGYSIYLSLFETQKDLLPSLCKEGSSIFTSFHVSEEVDKSYADRAEKMCRLLSGQGYRIIADVSRKTLNFFDTEDLIEFAKKMGIDILRIDYGYSEEEIAELAKQIPLCINASTISAEAAERIAKEAVELYAMHNFYPRPETGLDKEQFREQNRMLHKLGIKILAFIPGDLDKRGPIFEGLPTLEEHRKVAPYAAYIDLIKNYFIHGVFVGDGLLSKIQTELIHSYRKDSVINLPVFFYEENNSFFNQLFTIRVDSPKWLMRLQESREYSCFGKVILPYHCVERKAGSITMDNLHYQRYSGEIQIVRENMAADERVNVIGIVPPEYHLLLKNISNGNKIRFINI